MSQETRLLSVICVVISAKGHDDVIFSILFRVTVMHGSVKRVTIPPGKPRDKSSPSGRGWRTV